MWVGVGVPREFWESLVLKRKLPWSSDCHQSCGWNQIASYNPDQGQWWALTESLGLLAQVEGGWVWMGVTGE